MSGEKLAGLLQSMQSDILNDDSLTEKKRIVSTGSSATGSEGSVVINKGNIDPDINEQPLRIRTTNLNKNKDSTENDEEEDDFNDYVIEPGLPPPKELHPGKLYALFEFSGDDPSHCELERDDAVVLLNDQDNYWWLVRKESDNKIGFAPAECLETYDERLARLNCWKNEELERDSKENLDYPKLETSKNDTRLNKSVTFSNEVIVAKQTFNEDEASIASSRDTEHDDDLYSDEHDSEAEEFEEPDYRYEEQPYVGDKDEITSDNFPVTPLVLTKKSNRLYKRPEPFTLGESDIEDNSPLIAPNAFFTVNNNSGSIGEYSPSSSEFESPGDTPPSAEAKRNASREEIIKKANIPLSRGTRDIAHSIKLLDDLINDELNTTNSIDSDDDGTNQIEDGDVTLTNENESQQLLSSPISMNLDTKKTLSNATDLTYTNSNGSLHRLNSSSTTMELEPIPSLETLPSSSKEKQVLKSKEEIHPEIKQIFENSLNRMDSLTEKLKLLNQQLS